jgi:2-phosphosulfolactate phosphatase
VKVFVHLLPEVLNKEVCVLIDALRATCTISTALENGAYGVRVVESIEEALSYKGKAILAGERNGLKIEGFDLGNSPFDMKPDIVRGKEVVLTTTNGTKTAKMLKCNVVIAASFPNLPAVLEKLKEFREIRVVCSGDNGKISLEDTLLAGKIATLDENPMDLTRIVYKYAEKVKDIYQEVLRSSHAQKLIKMGFERDVEFCTKIGTQKVVPIMEKGVFRRG